MNRVISFFRVSSANYAPINYRFGSTTYQRHFQQRKPFPTAFVIPYSRHNNPQPNMVNSYNCPDEVSCQLFFFFISSRRQEGFERGTNLDARVVFQSILILFANPTQCVSGAKIEYEQYLLFGEGGARVKSWQILRKLHLFFFLLFFRLARRRKGGTARCPKPRGNPFSTPYQGLHV